MTRRDPHGHALPRRMHYKHGAYWHVQANRWRRLAPDYPAALREWARLEASASTASTVAQAVEAFFVDRSPELAPKTVAGYESSARRILAVFGACYLDEVDRPSVIAFQRARSAPVSANRDVAFLRAVFAYAVDRGWCEANPATVRRRPERARTRTAGEDEIAALARVAPPLWRALLATSLLVGTRPGELRLLRCVDAPLDGPGIDLTRPKTGARTLIEWSPALREAITAALAAHERRSVWVFPSRNGGPYTPAAFSRMFARLCKRAGISGLQARDMRRTAATMADDLEHARALLGHGSTAITRRVYRIRDKTRPTG
jgi:integrase